MVRKANPALLTPMEISPELEAVVGKGPMTRGQITKNLWVYIKGHKLQNPNNGQLIRPDDTLAAVLGKEELHMTKMGGKINAHIKK